MTIAALQRSTLTVLLAMARGTVLLAIASILWVGAYRFIDPPTSLNMILKRFEGVEVVRTPVLLAQIDPWLVRAVIAGEDANFCSHDGFDLEAMREALAEAQAGERRRGASTITQQAAKNAFLWNGGGLPRKAAEAWFAGLADLLWGKRRTMEIYLNLAEWGDGLYGAEAAAQGRFGVAAADLTPRQAARLAAVLPSPNRYRLDPPSRFVESRARTIERGAKDVEILGLDGCVLVTAP